MKRKVIMTKIEDIVDYWSSRVDECDLSVDWSEADSHCWRCGCEKNLERCHIVPYSLGGIDSPKNLVLLCKRCHAENPNVKDKEIMWDWIKAHKVSFYDTFWIIRGMNEYKFIYKKNFVQELIDLGMTGDKLDNMYNDIINEFKKKVSTHFGQPYMNTATIAGMYRMVIKKIKNRKLPVKRSNNISKSDKVDTYPLYMAMFL